MTAAEEQLYPCGDEYYPDDDNRNGAPRYESDFAYHKPRADVLLAGKCHPPGSKPVRTCPVTIRVGDWEKTLLVIGDRCWEKGPLRRKATEPEFFTEMDLRYENSFGGGEMKTNPAGKGIVPLKDSRGNKIWPLPNIENPADPVESRRSRPAPAGFGPLGRMWAARLAKAGTYTDSYRESRWPWFPDDFDWSHFNAAPPDMQVGGYLRGDEKLYFENLHPKHPQYHAQLPGIRVRCFTNKLDETERQEPVLGEVAMNLDTVWVDMETEKVVLIWRGWTEVLSEEYTEVQDLFIMSEPLEREPASPEECRRRFLDKRAEEEEAWAMEADEPAEKPEEVPESESQDQAKPAIDPAYLQTQVHALLAQMGIDPQNLPPEAKEQQSHFIRKLTETDPSKFAEMGQTELNGQMRETFAKLDLDPDNLPPVSAKAKAEQLRFIKEMDLKPADMAAHPEFGRILALMGAAMPKMGMDPENLEPLIEPVRKQRERLEKRFGTEDAAKDEEASPLTRDIVEERAARGESFAGEDLHGLDLSRLNLSNLDFSGAKFAGAVLAGSKLESAVLSGADLTGADLTDADCSGVNLAEADLTEAKLGKVILKDADCTAAILTEADLTGSVLTDAVFEKARMPGSVLDGIEAEGVNFSDADLTGCRFRESACAGADFSKAILDQAYFQGADLREASMESAVGRKIQLMEADISGLRASEVCDFSEGIFWNCVGPGSNWEDANLTACDFRGARMEGAIFTGTTLKNADLSFSDMRFSRFDKADLQEARLVQMNLFQGSLEKADLTGADLSGSNMYGVEFLDAKAETIMTEKTNLRMSKLHELMKQA